jgi:hypothetical protein
VRPGEQKTRRKYGRRGDERSEKGCKRGMTRKRERSE